MNERAVPIDVAHVLRAHSAYAHIMPRRIVDEIENALLRFPPLDADHEWVTLTLLGNMPAHIQGGIIAFAPVSAVTMMHMSTAAALYACLARIFDPANARPELAAHWAELVADARKQLDDLDQPINANDTEEMADMLDPSMFTDPEGDAASVPAKADGNE